MKNLTVRLTLPFRGVSVLDRRVQIVRMPNGKGFIDCRYCVYARPENGEWLILFGGPVHCLYHQKSLPAPSGGIEHRFCINIIANEQWYSEQGGSHIFFPFLRQVARFGAELKPGILYEYGYPNAGSLKQLAVLREPDYHKQGWKDST